MEAIILAGGMGTRLKDVIQNIAKPMAPVGDKPFLYYVFNWISRYFVEKVILSVGYKAESVIDFFGNLVLDIPVEYVIEEKPLGTGGAIKSAAKEAEGKDILVLNGDTLFTVDLDKFFEFHISTESLFSIALKKMHFFDRYGTVDMEGNTIKKFNEIKYCDDGLINGGIYLINKQFIDSWEMPEVFSLEKDILEKTAGKSFLKGMIFNDPFLDIGIPEDYSKAEIFVKKYFQL